MTETSWRALLSWTVVVPLVAIVALGLTWSRDLGPVLVAVVAVVLAATVLARRGRRAPGG